MVHLAAPVTARVVVDIVEADVPRTFHAVPVAGRGGDAERVPVLDPAHVTIAIRGPRALVEALDSTAVGAFVDLRDLAGSAPGRYNLPVTAEAVEEFRVTRIDPPRVEVRLR